MFPGRQITIVWLMYQEDLKRVIWLARSFALGKFSLAAASMAASMSTFCSSLLYYTSKLH